MAEEDANGAHGAEIFDIDSVIEQTQKFIKDRGGPTAGLIHLLEDLTPEQKSTVEKQHHTLGDRDRLNSIPEAELTDFLEGMSPEELRIKFCACAINGKIKTHEKWEQSMRHIEWVQRMWGTPREWPSEWKA